LAELFFSNIVILINKLAIDIITKKAFIRNKDFDFGYPQARH